MVENLFKGEVFVKEDAANVLGFTGNEIKENLSESIRIILDKNIGEFFKTDSMINMDTLKKAGTPHVLLRLKTLHIIFDGFRKTLGDQYLDVLRCIGEKVGFSFSVTLIDYLERDKSKIPFDYDALLDFWSLFDSRADMGTFTVKFDENNEKIEVIVEDNFLVKGYENDKHRHCAFFEGYIEGILDGAMCQWTRWIENSIYRPPRELWQVIRVKESRKEEQCLFTAEIMKENYITPRNLLVNAIQEFKKEDYNKAMLLARRSLEFAIKEPIHSTDADKIKFTQLVKAYQKYQIAISYQKWIDLYNTMSDVAAHSRRSITGDECLEYINLTRKLINEWSGIYLDDDTVTKVKGEKQKYGIF